MPCGCGGRKRPGQNRRRRSGRWGEPSMNVTGPIAPATQNLSEAVAALRGRPAPTMLCFGTHGPLIRNRTPSPAELRTSDAWLLDRLKLFWRIGVQNVHTVCIFFGAGPEGEEKMPPLSTNCSRNQEVPPEHKRASQSI